MTDLGKALELMHCARRQFHTIDARVRHWYSPARRYQAFERQRQRGGPMGSALDFPEDPAWETLSRLCVERPSRMRLEQVKYQDGEVVDLRRVVVDADLWWTYDGRYGSRSNHADPERPDAGAFTYTGFEHLVDPRGLGVELSFSVSGPVSLADRRAIGLRGTPCTLGKSNFASSPLGFTRGADEYDVVVDAERGVVLRLAALLDGEAFDKREVLAVAFDEALPEETFVFVAPGGEEPRPVPEPRAVTIEEAARLASFTVFILSSVPEGATMHVSYMPGGGGPVPGPTVSISYSFSDATPAIWLTQSASPGCWPKGAEWDRVECSGQQLFVLKKDSPEAWIHLDRDGTAVRIQSKFDRERLFQMAASLVPAPTRQPPLTSQG